MWYNDLGQVIRYVNSGKLYCREEYITRKGWNSRALAHDKRDRDATEVRGRRCKPDNKNGKQHLKGQLQGAVLRSEDHTAFANVGS
jgi:hypothetical protein